MKKYLNHIFIDGLAGMAHGLFATLIVGTSIQQIGMLVGGSIGALLGMLLFRHKTNHRSFRTGLPVILVIHIIIFVTFRNVLF